MGKKLLISYAPFCKTYYNPEKYPQQKHQLHDLPNKL